MNGTNCNDNERGLLPYPVILAATKGDPDAMKIVVQHYQSYIAHLSMRKRRKITATQHRANQIRSFCAEPCGGCAMTLL